MPGGGGTREKGLGHIDTGAVVEVAMMTLGGQDTRGQAEAEQRVEDHHEL